MIFETLESAICMNESFRSCILPYSLFVILSCEELEKSTCSVHLGEGELCHQDISIKSRTHTAAYRSSTIKCGLN